MSHHYHEDDEEERARYTTGEMARMVKQAKDEALRDASYEDLMKELERRQQRYRETLVGVPTDVLEKEIQRREEESRKPKLLMEEE
jgi:hypothetical protein